MKNKRIKSIFVSPLQQFFLGLVMLVVHHVPLHVHHFPLTQRRMELFQAKVVKSLHQVVLLLRYIFAK